MLEAGRLELESAEDILADASCQLGTANETDIVQKEYMALVVLRLDGVNEDAGVLWEG